MRWEELPQPEDLPPGVSQQDYWRAVRRAWADVVEIGSNIRHVPDDITEAADALYASGLARVVSMRIEPIHVPVPDYEPAAWGTYIPSEAWPHREEDWTGEAIGRFERDPWAAWRRRAILGWGRPLAGDPKLVRRRRLKWLFFLTSLDGKAIPNAVEVESFLRDMGFWDALATQPAVVEVRKAIGDEVHGRIVE